MPTISQHNLIEIKPETFVHACSDDELYGLWLIMTSAAVQKRIEAIENNTTEQQNVVKVLTLKY
jgi:hypothetical protein